MSARTNIGCCLAMLAAMGGGAFWLVWEDSAYLRQGKAARAAIQPGMSLREALIAARARTLTVRPIPDDGLHPELHLPNGIERDDRIPALEAEIQATTSTSRWMLVLEFHQTRTDSFGVSRVKVPLDGAARVSKTWVPGAEPDPRAWLARAEPALRKLVAVEDTRRTWDRSLLSRAIGRDDPDGAAVWKAHVPYSLDDRLVLETTIEIPVSSGASRDVIAITWSCDEYGSRQAAPWRRFGGDPYKAEPVPDANRVAVEEYLRKVVWPLIDAEASGP